MGSVPSARAQGTPGQVGLWTGEVDAGATAIHMALLRGPADSSRVLYWASGTTARLWRYAHEAPFSAADVIQVPCASNIFCSGHSTLADGRLLVANGHVNNFVGLDDANLFDPLTNQWAAQNPMVYPRWYPNCVTLPDGGVLVSSGDMYLNMEVFGGTETSPMDLLSTLAIAEEPFWTDITDLSPRPEAREEHSAVYASNLANTMIFGGLSTAGMPLADVWLLKRTDNDTAIADHTWTWTQLTPQADPTYGSPAARSRGSAVFYPADSSVVIYGGLAAGATVLGDTWKLYLLRRGSQTIAQWKRIDVLAPRARYGHSAIFGSSLPYLAATLGLDPVMVVFAGHDGTSPTDSLWALDLTSGGERWVALAATGIPPSARLEHSATQLASFGSTPSRMLVFGGQQGASYFSDLRALEWRATGPQWVALAPTGAPSPRARHSAVHDGYKFIVFGGESAPGVPLGDCLTSYTPALSSWQSYAAAGPDARMGHSAIYHPTPVRARIPEIFSASPDNTGSWQQISNAVRKLTNYPLMFLLPNGQVFYVGRTTATRLLNLATGQWASSSIASSFSGGSAAMYRPGLILKHGSTSTPIGTTERIDMTAPAPQWTLEAPSAAREQANLTVLPTGDVLLTGGCSSDTCTVQRSAQIWRPGTGWTPALALDPMRRDYHSTALLLPDGRVLSGGGDAWSYDQKKFTIYSPPYLFTAAGDPAPRPQITISAPVVNYQHDFIIHTPEAANIASVCLIRPGSVTHGFNQNQRYVPLTFTAFSAPPRLVAQAPTDSIVAPPGDYLLFIVDQSSVPSIATWLRVALPRGPVVGVIGEPPTLEFSISANPVRAAAEFQLGVGADQVGLPLELVVFDLAGRRVRTLLRGQAEVGGHGARWDLTTARGDRVRNAVYLARFTLGGWSRTIRVVVMR